ncbi:aminotransferase class III-fold pyridoxal phosphate-dependent enzyme [Nesterenkonia ebinurensis]|uniref:aminotransferase class III-fold pyridoxal phosphate-dependent enzyme n=1 Tax=Nesterenkonia ebinurensis TaxID=2608252 RepID=UPI001CC3A010|nr:aminotransferase class III-fold pyridoxal phosphate-dependent enzyme [Nesterenkonia ebinurensis]
MITKASRMEHTLTADAHWRERAARVIPGGMYGHMNASRDKLPSSYPQYYVKGKGARLWDVDGNEYIDYLCAYGPMILGYVHPEVEKVAAKQQANGDGLSGPTPLMVELAETLTEKVAHADWSIFAKNGTDATSIAVMTARAATGRKKLLKARRAYHGASVWFTPQAGGITPQDRENIIEFEFNDQASLELAALKAGDDLAAVILPPFRHDSYADQEEVLPAFARAARALTTRMGAVLILDEVRSCLRLDIRGAWTSIGVFPDLTAFSKSLANGFPLAAITGTEALREAAKSIFVTGSFWYHGVPMAAALETLRIIEAVDGPSVMRTSGELLRTGLNEQAESYGFSLRQTGPASMPMIAFDDDPQMERIYSFSDAAVRQGVLFHPWHNMFISLAHTQEEIDKTLVATEKAFEELSRNINK